MHPAVRLTRRLRMNISSSLNGSLQTRLFFLPFFFNLLNGVASAGLDKSNFEHLVTQRDRVGISSGVQKVKVNKHSKPLKLFFLQTFSLASALCPPVQNIPLLKHAHKTCRACSSTFTFTQISIRQTRVYVILPVAAVLPRPYHSPNCRGCCLAGNKHMQYS